MANVTVSVSAETTFTCTYSNVSDTCTVTVQTHLYEPLLDGTETLKQLSGSTTVANGEMSGGAAYLVGGWDNTIDWELTFEGYYESRDGSAIGLYFGNPTQRDRNVAKIMPPTYNRLYSYNSSGSSTQDGNFNSITVSTWLSFNIKKTGSTLTVKIGNNNATTHTFRYTSETNVCIGLDTWSAVSKIRNIIVDAL